MKIAYFGAEILPFLCTPAYGASSESFFLHHKVSLTLFSYPLLYTSDDDSEDNVGH